MDGHGDGYAAFREGNIPLCPVCGRELDGPASDGGKKGGWDCRCGEFIPERLALYPFEGCTHGRNCNCGRRPRAAAR